MEAASDRRRSTERRFRLGELSAHNWKGRAVITIAQVESLEQIGQARELLTEYLTFIRLHVDNQLADPENAPPMAGYDEELAALPGVYQPPGGRLLLALVDGTPAGCIGLRPFEGPVGEVKRMWVRPAARRLGIGRALTEKLIAEARAAGYERLILSTVDKLLEAQRLYASLGFERTEPYYTGPEDMMAHEIFMRLDL